MAEKPSVANNIAYALGADKREQGYFIGNNFIVTFGFGHVIELQSAADYDSKYEKWELEYFPFIPEAFKHKVKTDDDGGAKKQFNIIKGLFNRPDVECIINGCDLDREGELIFHLVYEASGSSKPVYRLELKEQTPVEVKAGMNNLKKYSDTLNIRLAGLTRQIADWIIGINLTSVATKKFGTGGTLNIGRLLLAITVLVYSRTVEIVRFKPKPYYEFKANFKASKGTYEGLFYKDGKEPKLDNKDFLEGIQKEINGASGTVTSKEVKISKVNAKKLFSMTDLQGYITSKYNGFTADKVLKYTQKLYEKKLLSYPRTPSNYLDESLVENAEKVLEAVTRNFQYKDQVKFHSGKSVFDTSKVVSHSAIIPTYLIPAAGDLDENELIIYNEVKNRFISHFMPAAEYEVTEIITNVKGYMFKTNGKRLVKEGWRVLYSKDVKSEEDQEDGLKLLPEVNKNENVSLDSSDILSKKTTPPAPYTVKTLLEAMKNCGKTVEEDDIQNILQGFTIGTDATRADAIKTVLDVGYIEQKGKSLYITEMGVKLIEKVPFGELLDINFTGTLEKKLKDIENGVFTMDKYLARIKSLVTEIVANMKITEVSIGKEKEVIGICPSCGKDIVENEQSYCCSGYKDGCKFSIWKENSLLAKFGMKKIPKALAKNLLAKGKAAIKVNYTKLIYISLEIKDGKWGLTFDFPSEEETKNELDELGLCPSCKGRIFETVYAYTCEHWKKDDPASCRFTVFKENKLLEKFDMNKISKSLMKSLLSLNKVTVKISPSTNIFATLVNSEGKWIVKFEFPSKEENQALREVIGKCPECGCKVYENNVGFYCENNSKEAPGGCKFALYKEDKFFMRFRKKINKSMAKALLDKKSVEVKDLFSEAKQKAFTATVLMKKNGPYWNFELVFNNKK